MIKLSGRTTGEVSVKLNCLGVLHTEVFAG